MLLRMAKQSDLPPIQIIKNEPEFIVVYKPADTNFHDEGKIGQGFFSRVKQQLSLSMLYPVHRLDKLTSGLVIMAKTADAARWFQQAFEQHTIDKYYIALSDHKPKKKQGMIKGDMAKSRRGMWKLLRSQENPAISQFFSYSVQAKLRLFILKPHTGRTHQLRVALASIAAPIFGDSLYHGNDTADRGYLHAYALNFDFNGASFKILAPPSEGELFQIDATRSQLDTIGEPWRLPWPKI